MTDFDDLTSSLDEIRRKTRGLSEDLASLGGDLDDAAREASSEDHTELVEMLGELGLPVDADDLRGELSTLSDIKGNWGDIDDIQTAIEGLREIHDNTGETDPSEIADLTNLGSQCRENGIDDIDDIQVAVSGWDRVVEAFGDNDEDDICEALELLAAIQHEFNLRGHEVVDGDGELQVGKILDNEGSDEVISSMKSLVAALRKAGVLDGTVSVPALPENGAPPVQQAAPESASDATTNS
tara:strand:- start:1634 stop:2353 length:720 start_codon:yes stop_codon:yes gene_type:complete